MSSDPFLALLLPRPGRRRPFLAPCVPDVPRSVWLPFLVLLGVLVTVRPAEAQSLVCAGIISADNLIPCVLSVSPVVRSEQVLGEATQARWQVATTWLPSNPILSLSGGRRSHEAVPTVTNWYVTLGQEVELAGQRGARMATAEADIRAQQHRIEGTRRQVVIEAWTSFFEVIAAREELTLQRRLEGLTMAVSQAARAAADRGLVSGIEADVVEASELKVRQGRIAAEGKLASSLASLASLLSRETEGLVVEGELEPLPGVEQAARATRLEDRPELKALAEERKALASRADLYRRLRIPNPTVSLFVQNDGFNERVLGLGLVFPLPLPSPIGRTFAGERAEAEALARRAVTETDRLLREGKRERARALADYEAKVRAREALPPDRIERAGRSLTAIADEVQKGRLSIRDAIVAQQTLLDLLVAQVAARRAVSLSSVELARAAGLDLERRQR